jgi:hypothetical protein
MTGEHPTRWFNWLLLAKWWYNTNFHSATQSTLNEILYRVSPLVHIPYVSKDSLVAAIDEFLFKRKDALNQIKGNL